MGNTKDFQVNYHLNVKAGEGVEQLKSFSNAVTSIASSQQTLDTAATSINKLFSGLNKAFAQSKPLNNSIGKTIAGLKQLQSGFDVNIRTDKAKDKLNELIGLMRTLKRESNINVNMSGGSYGNRGSRNQSSNNYTPSSVYRQSGFGIMPSYGVFSPKKPSYYYSNAKSSDWRYPKPRISQSNNSKNFSAWKNAAYNAQPASFAPISPNLPALYTPPPPPPTGRTPVRSGRMRQDPRQSAAMNRLQYSSTPSWRNLPFAGMLNAYFMYSAVKNELGDAISFTHTVDAAKQVLLTTDTDLGTFAERFSSMMANVRKIGVDTKFTMVEMAKATQYMAQAGFNTDQINSAIRPISDLALIADAPIQDITDNMTGILSGYRVDTGSTRSLADQMAATTTRSKATIQEMSESFKMSAGFLQMAGVDISEAVAAFGVLGNANLRGTMAGTSVRSMMTFLAKPSKMAKATLNRLGVDITQSVEVYGKTVRQLRPLADIFSDLKDAGVTLQDMSAIFGKIGGTGAMVLASRADELRELTQYNLYSHGIANKLGQAKQQTTSGLWEQVTSQWSESFTQVFESLEPRIKLVLKSLTNTLASDNFTAGLHTFGESLLSVFDIASKIGAWFVSNWSWIEPLFITGMAAKSILSVAGALSNIFVIIKSSATAATAANLAGTASGISSIGTNMGNAVNSGRGLVGSIASIGALGGTALAVAGGVSVLGGALAYAAYEGYQLNQRKEALQEELDSNRKYYYPSIESLKSALDRARQAAVDAKAAKDDLVSEATIGERFSNVDARSGIFSQWGHGILDWMGNMGMKISYSGSQSVNSIAQKEIKALRDAGKYEQANAKEQELQSALAGGYNSNYQVRMRKIGEVAGSRTYSKVEAQAWDYLDKEPTASRAPSAISHFRSLLTPNESIIDYSLYTKDGSGQYVLKPNLDKSKKPIENSLISHKEYLQRASSDPSTYTAFASAAEALKNTEYAKNLMFGEDANKVKNYYLEHGYVLSNGKLVPKKIGKNTPDSERHELERLQTEAQQYTSNLITEQSKMFGDKTRTTAAILKNTGLVPEDLLQNKVRQDSSFIYPSNFKNEDDSSGGGSGTTGGFGGAGGKYGGAGRMNSVTPKQVNVTITNLMSIETIKLMSTTEGSAPEIQNLKEQIGQVLMEVVHDFDSSWNS